MGGTAMKVSLGMRLQAGAWGGGNQFGQVLGDYLRAQGVAVRYDLRERDNDIILLAEPDGTLKISAYTHRDVLKHLLVRNRRAVVVQRFNNTSESRGDAAGEFNRFRLHANRIADHSVFVSEWVHQRFVAAGFRSAEVSIIHNGGNAALWRPGTPPADGRLHLITHHWSTHANKGHAVYQALDTLLENPNWQAKIAFTFIGRLPEGMRFRNARCLEPLAGEALAAELRQHHIYLSASRHEAGPNHIIEGALSGLPLLYLQSGATPEYAEGFGLSFTPETFAARLAKMLTEYPTWRARMADYPFTAERMCSHYLALFERLLQRRDALRRQRTWWKDPQWLIQTWRYRAK
ncbi:MAG: glycosyltransferase family 4 protein [Anaerolineae bacterium]|nr:glycosyltransferase family 4 protein [Anaerolineae bacterium]